MPPESTLHPEQTPAEPDYQLELVRAKVRDLRYGVVQLVVHDGRVTQIERTEKTRLRLQARGRAPVEISGFALRPRHFHAHRNSIGGFQKRTQSSLYAADFDNGTPQETLPNPRP